ncbi:hypothetical protein GCM10028803_61920 [Larkinella knui]|uniref:Cobyric acid synthase CobQ n=1 Tax=Larkinella knui TaxID=2025310 RepID=A0A3P1CB22_9BACT|nr:cobyric acid synthase CobQ [Larkinella knui]RRB10523.1 cobyric acid synthase CobQ [Larkinella knui]
MANPTIKYFPVGNGDMSLITLEDGTRILVDCKLTAKSDESTDPKIYDVKKDLLNSLQKRNGNYYVDVFILTHGDRDHCHGFKDNFYQGDPAKYEQKHRDQNLITMDTMWFSPMIAEQYTNDDEDAHQCEAERRLDLHRKNHADKDKPGNRIKIIGYDSNKDYKDLNHLRAVPGDLVTRFNDVDQKKFSIFIHAPFKIHLDSPDKDKNSASIVFQARFKAYSWDSDFCCLAMFGGDSDYTTWAQILERTKRFKNDVNQQALNWDLFLAPHHCSWSFFNDTSEDDVQSTSLEALDYARRGAWVIASSKKIVNNDDNPPYADAKKEYIKKLSGTDKFLNTSVEPKESAPEPIIFDITAKGPARAPKKSTGSASGSAGGAGAAGTVVTQG